MSMNQTPERCTPPADAWPLEKRREMMRDVVRLIASTCALKLENAGPIAVTYGVSQACVEAEMMKHLSESEGK